MRTDKFDLSGIKAVIFDLDGTLLDTEKLLCRFWRESAARHGYDMSQEQAQTLRSLTHRLVQPLFDEWFGKGCDYRELRKTRMELMQAFIDQHGVEKKAGASELLEYLAQNGYVRAIATATDTERAGRLLRTAGLDGCFDRIICASMVEWGKPRPDIYLYTAKELGLSPSQCIAAEDSPNGIISAHDAGCFTVMIPDLTMPDDDLTEKIDVVCKRLDDIIGLLESSDKHQ